MLDHKKAMLEAQFRWDGVYHVYRVTTPPDTIIRRCEGVLADHYGEKIASQWKVVLHSPTGPIRWLIELEDGKVLAE